MAPAGSTGHSPTSLVSVMTANNETGVVQDMAALVERVREASGSGRPGEAKYVPVHSDVVAALGKVPVDFHGWGPGCDEPERSQAGGRRWAWGPWWFAATWR